MISHVFQIVGLFLTLANTNMVGFYHTAKKKIGSISRTIIVLFLVLDIPVTLIHPFNIDQNLEPEVYEKPDGHAEAGAGTFDVRQKQDTSIASKSGYLTKRGNIVKV